MIHETKVHDAHHHVQIFQQRLNKSRQDLKLRVRMTRALGAKLGPHLHYHRVLFDAVAAAADAVLVQQHARDKHAFNASVKIVPVVNCVGSGARSDAGIQKRSDLQKYSAWVGARALNTKADDGLCFAAVEERANVLRQN